MIRFYIILIILLFFSCKNEIIRKIYITTGSVYFMDSIYYVDGELIDLGTGITDYGHCWSTNPNPTTSNNKTQLGNADNLLIFSSSMNNLVDGNTYYIRAYAQDENEVVYSNEIVFTDNTPIVSIEGVYLKNLDSALVTGTLDIKGDTIGYEYGLCWTMNNNIPTIEDEVEYIGETEKNITFESFIVSLIEGETYNIRAYARNENSVCYSEKQTIIAGSVIFYNSLDSESDLTTEVLYPVIYQQSYNTTDWSRAFIAPAVYGNGLYINHELDEGWGPVDSANFFAIDASDIKLSIERGSIEFWFVFNFDDDTANTAYFFYMANELTNHFNNRHNQDNTFIYAGRNGWKQDFADVQNGFFFKISDPITGKKKSIEVNSGESNFSELLNFEKGTALHFNFVWDINGIYNSDETMQIYINGIKVAQGKHKWNINGEIEKYLYLGTIPGYGSRTHYYNAVKGIIDELKIYDFANTGYN